MWHLLDGWLQVSVGMLGGVDHTSSSQYTPTVKKKEQTETETQVTPPPEVKEETTLTPVDHETHHGQTNTIVDQVDKVEQEIVEQHDPPSEQQMGVLKEGSGMLGKFLDTPPLDVPPPPKDGPPPVKSSPVSTTSLSLEEQLKAKKKDLNLGPSLEFLDSKISGRQMAKMDKELIDVKPVKTGVGSLKQIAEGLDAKKHLSGLWQMMDLGMRENNKSMLAGVIQDNFTDVVKDLDKAWLKSSKQQVYDQAQDMGKQLGGLLKPTDPFYKTLQGMSDTDRRDAIAQAMGLIKDKHAGKGYDALPENKQKLVDAILTGLNEGLQTKSKGTAQGPRNSQEFKDTMQELQDQVGKQVQEMVKHVAGNGDLLKQISMSSDTDLKAMIGTTIGLEGTSGLHRLQNEFLDKAVETLKKEVLLTQMAPLKDQVANTPEQALQVGKDFVQGHAGDREWMLNMSIRSDNELKNAIAASMHNGSDYGSLTEEQRGLVDNVLKGMRSAQPISMSNETTTVNSKDWGNFNVPSTFNVDGKTYGEPKFIAKGGGGIVIRYTNPEPPHDNIAVKRANQDPEALVTEVKSHQNAMGPEGHDNILKMRGAVRLDVGGQDTAYMVMDFANGSNLTGLTQSIGDLSSRNILSQSDNMLLRQFMSKGALDGMIHVQEERDMMHLDIKPDNVLFDSDSGKIMIMDFGESRSNQSIKDEIIGTGHYMAPEFERKEVLDKTADTFSMGQMFHELVTGRLVIGSTDDFASDVQSRNAQFEGPALKDTPTLREGSTDVYNQSGVTDFGQVINQTFTSDKESRAKLSELRQQSFFTDSLGSDERAVALLRKIVELRRAEPQDKERIEQELRQMSGQLNLG